MEMAAIIIIIIRYYHDYYYYDDQYYNYIELGVIRSNTLRYVLCWQMSTWTRSIEELFEVHESTHQAVPSRYP